MGTNVEARLLNLERAIQANENEANRLKRVSRNIQLAREAVEQSITEMQKDPDFQGKDEVQIHFHRHQLPLLIGKWLFFQKCYALECISLASTGDKRKALLSEELQQAKDFFQAYRGFIQYYFSEDQRLDSDLFTIKSTVVHPLMEAGDDLPFQLNPGCLLASYLLAFLEFARLLLQEADDPTADRRAAVPDTTVSFKGNIIDLVEVGMLLWMSRAFIVNGKPATEKYIFARLEEAFKIPIGNISQRISELKRRREPLEKVKEWARMANAHLGNFPEDRSRRKAG